MRKRDISGSSAGPRPRRMGTCSLPVKLFENGSQRQSHLVGSTIVQHVSVYGFTSRSQSPYCPAFGRVCWASSDPPFLERNSV